MLVERDELLERLEPLFAECAEGRGATAVISGGAGLGKTALLEAVAERSAERGHLLLSAVGSRAEREFPYGVLEQLFHRVGRAECGTRLPELLEQAAVAGDPGANPARIMQATYRTLMEMSGRGPVTISIDDVQYADPESLRCLLHLIRRCRRAPVAVLLACGSADPGESQTLLAELACRPGIRHVSLTALSREGVGRLVAERFGDADEQRARDFFHASGGNPLLVQALLHDHSVHGADDGDRRPVPGDVFRDASLACVHRSGRDSLRVARGIAVLDGAGSTALLGRLVGLGDRAVHSALKILSDARLLDGTRFRHPMVRAGVLDEVPAEDRARLHAKAALLLREEGAPTTAVASHLLAGGAVREDWAVRLLVEAADEALAEDRVEHATRFLHLAGTRCTDEKQRHLVSMGLAQIMRRVRPEAATRILQDLAGPAREGNLPGSAMIKVAHGLLMRGQVDEAVEILGPLGAVKTTDRQFAAELDIARLWLASTYPGAAERLKEPLGRPLGQRPAERHTAAPRVSANRALWITLAQGADESVVAEAERVLQSLPIGDRTIDSLVSSIMTLVYADRLKTAASWCDQMLARAADRRAPMWSAQLLAARALIALRQGGLGRAAELAESALDLMPEEAWGVGIGMPLAVLIEARTAMGDYKAGADLVNRPVPEMLFLTRFGLHYLYARGRYHLAAGDDGVALADFLACGEKARAWGLDSPVLAPWRIGAMEALLLHGQRERAGEIADEHLALAATGQRRTHGIALRALAATRPPSQRLEPLSKSLEMLQPTGDRYETALTLADLGRTYQRHGRVGRARLIIRQAWHMAKECGAEELQSALMPKPTGGGEETEPAGPPGGRDDAVPRLLSEAEMRVTALAAQGFTNREISNKLFITVSTVEQHLTRVYRKLNIRHRQELPASFA